MISILTLVKSSLASTCSALPCHVTSQHQPHQRGNSSNLTRVVSLEGESILASIDEEIPTFAGVAQTAITEAQGRLLIYDSLLAFPINKQEGSQPALTPGHKRIYIATDVNAETPSAYHSILVSYVTRM